MIMLSLNVDKFATFYLKQKSRYQSDFHAIIVEVTGFEPVSKHILQKLSTCLFCFEVFREATGNKQPITSLAAWS